MRPIIQIAALLAATVITAPSFADDGDDRYVFARTQLETCSHGNQLQMNECITSKYHESNQRMIAYYSKLVRMLKRAEGVQMAQQAWERYRDAECSDRVMQSGAETSLYAYADAACRIEMTEERIKLLRWHLAQDCNGCPERN